MGRAKDRVKKNARAWGSTGCMPKTAPRMGGACTLVCDRIFERAPVISVAEPPPSRPKGCMAWEGFGSAGKRRRRTRPCLLGRLRAAGGSAQ